MGDTIEAGPWTEYVAETDTLHIEIVGGPKPYVWVGDKNGRYLGSVDDLGALRDALTASLRRARTVHALTP